MQEQLLEKHVPEYPVAGPNPSPHRYFQNCKQQTGVSLSFLCASAPLFLSFCSLIALLLLFPRFFLLFPSDCSPSSDILLLHVETLSVDPLWLFVPLSSLPHLLSALHLYSSLLFLHPSPTYTELGKMQKIVIPRETGGMSLELGVAIGCKEKHSQVGGGEFLSMRMRGTRITWEGRKKNPRICSSSPFQKRRISRSLSYVQCICANICYKPDMSPCSGSAGLVPCYFSTYQVISC